jgi:predicted  nucleic acid-binding Zn-ribbon protein
MPKVKNPQNSDELNELQLETEKLRALAAEAQQLENATQGLGAIHFYTTAHNKNVFTAAEQLYAHELFISKVEQEFAKQRGTRLDYDVVFDESTGVKRRPQFLIDASQDPATKSVDISYQADKGAPVVTHARWLAFFRGPNLWNTELTSRIQSGPPLPGRGSDYVIEVVEEGTPPDTLCFKARQISTGTITELSPDEAQIIGALIPKAMQAFLIENIDPDSAPCIYTHPCYDASLLDNVVKKVKSEIQPVDKPTQKQNIINGLVDAKNKLSNAVTPSPATKRTLKNAGTNVAKVTRATKQIYKASIDAMPDQAKALRQLNRKARAAKRKINSNLNAGTTAAESAVATGMHHAAEVVSPAQSLYELHKNETALLNARHKNELEDQNQVEQTLVDHIEKDYEEITRGKYAALDNLVDEQKRALDEALATLTDAQNEEINEMAETHAAKLDTVLKPDPLLKLLTTQAKVAQLQATHQISIDNITAEHNAARIELVGDHAAQNDSAYKALLEEHDLENAELIDEQKLNLSNVKLARETLYAAQRKEQTSLQKEQQDQLAAQIIDLNNNPQQTLKTVQARQAIELQRTHQQFQHQLDSEQPGLNQREQELNTLRRKFSLAKKQVDEAKNRLTELELKPDLAVAQKTALTKIVKEKSAEMAKLQSEINAHTENHSTAQDNHSKLQEALYRRIENEQNALNTLHHDQLELERRLLNERRELKVAQGAETKAQKGTQAQAEQQLANIINGINKDQTGTPEEKQRRAADVDMLEHQQSLNQIIHAIEDKVLHLQHLVAQQRKLQEQINNINLQRVDPADTWLKKMTNENIEQQMADLQAEIAKLNPIIAALNNDIDQLVPLLELNDQFEQHRLAAEKRLHDIQDLERIQLVIPERGNDDTVEARLHIQELELRLKHQQERHIDEQRDLTIILLSSKIEFYQRILDELRKQHAASPIDTAFNKMNAIQNLINNQLQPHLQSVRNDKDLNLAAKQAAEKIALEQFHQNALTFLEQQNNDRNTLLAQQRVASERSLEKYEEVVKRLEVEESNLESIAANPDDLAFQRGDLEKRREISGLLQHKMRDELTVGHAKADLALLDVQINDLRRTLAALPPAFIPQANEILAQRMFAMNAEISRLAALTAKLETSIAAQQVAIPARETTLRTNFETMENALLARNSALVLANTEYNNQKMPLVSRYDDELAALNDQITPLERVIASTDRSDLSALRALHANEIQWQLLKRQRELLIINHNIDLATIEINYLKAQKVVQEVFLNVIRSHGQSPVWVAYITSLEKNLNGLNKQISDAEQGKTALEAEKTQLQEKHVQENLDLLQKHESELGQIETAITAIKSVFAGIINGTERRTLKDALGTAVVRLRDATGLSDNERKRVQHFLCCFSNAAIIQQKFGHDFLVQYLNCLQKHDPLMRTDQVQALPDVDFNIEIAIAFSNYDSTVHTIDDLKYEIKKIMVKADPASAATNNSKFVAALAATQKFFMGNKADPDSENKVKFIFNDIEQNQRLRLNHHFVPVAPVSTTSALYLAHQGYQYVYPDNNPASTACRKAKTACVIRQLGGAKTNHNKTLQAIYVVLCNHLYDLPADVQVNQKSQYDLLKTAIETVERACLATPNAAPSLSDVEAHIIQAAHSCAHASIIMSPERKRLLIQLVREINPGLAWAPEPGPIAKQVTPKEDVMNAFIRFKLADNRKDQKEFKDAYLKFFQGSWLSFIAGNQPKQFDQIEFPAGIDHHQDDIHEVKLVIDYGKKANFPKINVEIFRQAVEKIKDEAPGFQPVKRSNKLEWFENPVEQLENVLRREKAQAAVDINYAEEHPIFNTMHNVNNRITF